MAIPRGGPADRLTPAGDGSGRGLDQTGDDSQQGRFARTGATKQTDDFAGFYGEIDIFQHEKLIAIGFGEASIDLLQVDQSRFGTWVDDIEHGDLQRWAISPNAGGFQR